MTISSSEPPYEPSDTATLTETDRHRLLSSERRRTLLAILEDRSLPVAIDDLAMAVGIRERGDDVGAETVERIAVTLHHNHLPKLAEAGVVEYDSSANYVASFRGEISS